MGIVMASDKKEAVGRAQSVLLVVKFFSALCSDEAEVVAVSGPWF